MNTFQAGLADVYGNVEKKLGSKAWILPYAVAAGAFLLQKGLLKRNTTRALISSAMTGATAAGLMGAG
ncbi:MAG: hypothetical protein H7Y17_07820, partial [Chlorobia bacterium]|nr:hypothetical protein [Fimbriimonadaceae bacterium]